MINLVRVALCPELTLHTDTQDSRRSLDELLRLTHRLYLESFKDKDGNWLDGSKNYKLHVPANVPAEEFWSITVYDNLTRSMTMNKANKAAISSYDKIAHNADGSADLYFGPKAPQGLASNWVDTSASKGWFVWFRFYGPKEPFFDKTWKLPDFEKVN